MRRRWTDRQKMADRRARRREAAARGSYGAKNPPPSSIVDHNKGKATGGDVGKGKLGEVTEL